MVQLQILSGKQAGARWVARRFPVRIGRDNDSDLQLEQDGVWDQHCELTLDRAEGFVLSARLEALMAVNHQPVRSTRLRNGDIVELGSARLRFWLAEVPQRGLIWREAVVWLLVAIVSAAQIALLYLMSV